MMFLDCPAWLDKNGAVRCGLPAEVRRRYITRSTDGPIESTMIRCPAGHWFNGPIEYLTSMAVDHDLVSDKRAVNTCLMIDETDHSPFVSDVLRHRRSQVKAAPVR